MRALITGASDRPLSDDIAGQDHLVVLVDPTLVEREDSSVGTEVAGDL